LRSEFKAENAAMNILHSEIDRENISARGFHRVLRLAWSIADSEGHDRPTSEDIKRALDLRGTLGIFG
jgi:magnesium chelatase family protein